MTLLAALGLIGLIVVGFPIAIAVFMAGIGIFVALAGVVGSVVLAVATLIAAGLRKVLGWPANAEWHWTVETTKEENENA